MDKSADQGENVNLKVGREEGSKYARNHPLGTPNTRTVLTGSSGGYLTLEGPTDIGVLGPRYEQLNS